MQKLHYGIIGIFLVIIALTTGLWWSGEVSPTNPVITPAEEPAVPPATAPTSSPVIVPSTELDITPAKPCMISGCSGQICSDSAMMSTCEYKEVYQCYKSARCERNMQGVCGWVEDDTLRSCLAAYQ